MTFATSIVPDFFDFLDAVIYDKEKFSLFKHSKEDKEIDLLSVKTSKKKNYLISLKPSKLTISLVDKKFKNSKKENQTEPHIILSTILLSKDFLKVFASASQDEIEEIINGFFKIVDKDELLDFFKEYEYHLGLENFYLLNNKSQTTEFENEDGEAISADLIFLFSVYKNRKFTKSLSLGDDDYHYNKLTIPNKEIISYSNSASDLSDVYIFEKDLITNNIKVFYDTYEGVENKGFKCESIVIGKYPKVIKHYIENESPIFEIENNIVIKNSSNRFKDDLYWITKALSEYLNIDIPLPFDSSSFEEFLNHVVITDMNVIYSCVLWGYETKWVKGEKGFYLKFDRDMFYSEGNYMRPEPTGKGYISLFDRKKSSIMKAPKDIAPDWIDFVKKGYEYVINNYAEFRVCEAKEKDFVAVEKHLKSIGII